MAIGQSTFADIGGAVSDLYQADAFRYKAKGAQFEKQNYELASGLADKNADYADLSTAIQQRQADRALYKSQGEITADVASSGFAQSGSALDILRDSASQASLQKAVLTEQGYIQEQGYKEQADSYRNMAQASQVAIDAANTAAQGSEISAGIKGIAALASLIP